MINTTIWSIYTHSPRSLVKEFILVDYNSSPKKLDEYIQEIPVKIRAFKLQNTSNVAEAKQFAVQFVTVLYTNIISIPIRHRCYFFLFSLNSQIDSNYNICRRHL